MLSFLGLDELMRAGRPVHTRVASGLKRERDSAEFDEFRLRVATWRARFRRATTTEVGLYFEDSFEFAAALLGAWAAGKVALLPGDALPATVAQLLPRVSMLASDLPELGVSALAAEIEAPETRFDALALDTPAVIIYTSGSSGDPVAIPKTLAQLDREVRELEANWGSAVASATIYATVSHQHIYGLLFKVLWPLAAGRSFYAPTLTYPEELLEHLSREHSVLVASPAHLKRLPADLPWERCRGSVRMIFSSGGPLEAAVSLDCARMLGQAVVEVYGSSETGGIAWRARRRLDDDLWQRFDDVRLRIDSPTGQLEVKSARLPDEAWFTMADRARAAHGENAVESVECDQFVLMGRADRIAKVEGKRVSLTAIEDRLRAHPLVTDAAVVMLSGSRDVVGAAVVLNPTGQTRLAEEGRTAVNLTFRDWLREAVEPVALPRRWRYVPHLPANPQGKVTQSGLLNLFSGQLPPYEVLSSDATSAELCLVAGSETAFFNGHFPNAPILPGAAQIHWAVLAGQEIFAISENFTGMELVKFQNMVQPDTELTMSLEYRKEVGKLSFRIYSRAGVHSSGRLIFGTSI